MSRFALALVAAFILAPTSPAAGPYDDLLPYVPPHCNTLVLLNIKSAYDSPLAKSEKWSESIYQRYKAGMGFVPPDGKAVVISSQVNFSNMTRDHQIGLVRVTGLPSTKGLAEREGGTTDLIADMGVVLSPRNMYLTSLSGPALAMVYPADRQATARWLRHAKMAKKPDLAPYLQKAADAAGDDVLTVQDRIGEQGVIEIAGGDGIGLDRAVQLQSRDVGRDRTIQQAGVKMRQPVMLGQRARDSAFARGGRSVDGNDHRRATKVRTNPKRAIAAQAVSSNRAGKL